jgi:ribosomal protein L37E
MADPWRYHRALKSIGLISILLVFLIAASVALGLISERSRGFHLLVYCWMVLGLVMLTATHEVRCPRCGQRFYAKRLDFWQLTKTCLHCGQEKYAEVAASSRPKPDLTLL